MDISSTEDNTQPKTNWTKPYSRYISDEMLETKKETGWFGEWRYELSRSGVSIFKPKKKVYSAIVERISIETTVLPIQVRRVLKVYHAAIEDNLKAGIRVPLFGFGVMTPFFYVPIFGIERFVCMISFRGRNLFKKDLTAGILNAAFNDGLAQKIKYIFAKKIMLLRMQRMNRYYDGTKYKQKTE